MLARAATVAFALIALTWTVAPVAVPAAAGATSCPDRPVTLEDVMNLHADRGPLATEFPPAVAWINERARACFGSSNLRFRAFVNGSGGLGGASAYSIRPRWLLGPSLIVFASDQEVEPGVGDGPPYGIAVPPGFGKLQDRYAGSWVMITAHFKDARASSCRATGAPGDTPSRAQAVRICQSVLVLSRIQHALDMPSTDAHPGVPSSPAGSPPPWAALVSSAGLGWWLWRRRMRA